MNKPHICIVSTVPFVIKWFMLPHIIALKKHYKITLVSSEFDTELRSVLGDDLEYVSINIERDISIFKDLLTLIKLFILFKTQKYDCVHSIMPKSGLLAMIAAKLASISVRIHTFTGQVWVTKTGLKKMLLKFLDRVLARCATNLLADGNAQRQFLINNKIVIENKINVLADGSFAGVNLSRFKMNEDSRRKIRNKYGITDNSQVFIYLGRLNYDKGILELIDAFIEVCKKFHNIHLMIVGADEERFDDICFKYNERYPGKIHRVHEVNNPEDYISASDILCLPSHREGFPNVPLQAAAAGLPTIGSRIYGIADAVEDRVTGLLHNVRDMHDIQAKMTELLENQNLRLQLGINALQRVQEKYSEERLTKSFIKYYKSLLYR